MEHSPLNKMPAEIRNQIIEQVLLNAVPLRMRFSQPWPRYIGDYRYVYEHRYYCILKAQNDQNVDNHHNHIRALTQTCRQLRSETQGMFFSINKFIVDLQQLAETPYEGSGHKGDGMLDPVRDILALLPQSGEVHELEVVYKFMYHDDVLVRLIQSVAAATRHRARRVVFTLATKDAQGLVAQHENKVKIRIDLSRFVESCREGTQILLKFPSSLPPNANPWPLVASARMLEEWAQPTLKHKRMLAHMRKMALK
ncbi:hypothetical protein LTR09_005348 [Extremus antarcticus]|uniref:Uncharacterized protein n=1 Tax=Extremus antarcticus TaxID=702011 RepID=A0AAJ0G8R1_9PEZI|nr:hypothetical protein LTR09_005348 [Extremus antarcticus]